MLQKATITKRRHVASANKPPLPAYTCQSILHSTHWYLLRLIVSRQRCHQQFFSTVFCARPHHPPFARYQRPSFSILLSFVCIMDLASLKWLPEHLASATLASPLWWQRWWQASPHRLTTPHFTVHSNNRHNLGS